MLKYKHKVKQKLYQKVFLIRVKGIGLAHQREDFVNINANGNASLWQAKYLNEKTVVIGKILMDLIYTSICRLKSDNRINFNLLKNIMKEWNIDFNYNWCRT